MQLLTVPIEKPDDVNLILGQAHFIKTVEDLHETLAGASPHLRFGIAFCESSGPRLIRRSGNDHVAALEQEFRAALGVRVKLSHTTGGKGKLTIHFTNHEEFEQIRQHICGQGPTGAKTQAG